MEPVIIIQEVARISVEASNQRRYPVSGAIKQALTPAPQSILAARRPGKLVEKEEARLPRTAIPRK